MSLDRYAPHPKKNKQKLNFFSLLLSLPEGPLNIQQGAKDEKVDFFLSLRRIRKLETRDLYTIYIHDIHINI